MGVPKFYRWLSERYPLINQAITDATLLPVFDNLYLDMNGYIHQATHGNDGLAQVVTDEVVVSEVMGYIDRIVKTVKPLRVLFMALDGVAPRAKMNQQRSRRFRAAQELQRLRREAVERGEEVVDTFDSNCITPGTDFMARISRHVTFAVRERVRNDPTWSRLRVIFSGGDVPGEGEHKIIDFIRAEKARADYDPNTRHCMAGLDADLIMLGLATHEPHFALLREQVDFKAFGRPVHGTKDIVQDTRKARWQLLHISLLRECLEVDMRPARWESVDKATGEVNHPGFEYEGERVVDDFVLLTALCGNDFLPHLMSLDIGFGAIDHLLRVYRETLPDMGGYIDRKSVV
jgi:5'-3' exoribonuclease 1